MSCIAAMMKSTPVEDNFVNIVAHCNKVVVRINVILRIKTKVFEKARRIAEKAVTRQDTKNIKQKHDRQVRERRIIIALRKIRLATEKAVTRQDTKNSLEVIRGNNIRIVFVEEN